MPFRIAVFFNVFIGVSFPAERASASDGGRAFDGLRSLEFFSGGVFSRLVLPRRCRLRVKLVFPENCVSRVQICCV